MASKQYDGELQMFIEPPRDPDLRRLRFMRWLVENNRLEHPVIGPASGEITTLIIGEALEELPLAQAFPKGRDGRPLFNRLALDPGREI